MLDLKLLSVAVISAAFFVITNLRVKPTIVFTQKVNQEISHSAFFEPRLFSSGINYAQKSSLKLTNRPKIIIVPHHLLASYIIADLISSASKFTYDSIYIIGPNHFESGPDKFVTSDSPLGKLIISQDHSIGGPMLFVDYYFPYTPTTQVIIKHDAALQDISDWTNMLISSNYKNVLYIFSIDFSHYLPANVAAKKDELTEKLILDGNPRPALELSNDYVDSPSVLALSISLARKSQLGRPQIIHHTNSGYLLSDFSSPTTSYFGIIITDQNKIRTIPD